MWLCSPTICTAAAAALLAPALAGPSTASAGPGDRERALHRYEAPAQVEVVGGVYHVPVKPDEALAEVAEREGVGVERLRAANPHTATENASERALRIPARHVLPDTPREGLVIDVAGMRLFHYPEETDAVEVFPISTGREGWPTPVAMKTEVAERLENPAWYPPESIRDSRAASDESGSLPRMVPPGAENPLGEHVLILEVDGYLVHGTNEPHSIGERTSHGCARMHPQDIEHLFERVKAGTPVRFVDQPFRIGRSARFGSRAIRRRPTGRIRSLTGVSSAPCLI
ncbi:L,D-transpeptidase family protein [Halorhodospira halochloris]|uniref:L,D-transpeptidase family protein n=1 Tax=Halorhodospira halochloris TaxID=1052 RepID=UPI001EE9319C|nr:L,D-transpeptidase family protein [Halorhodospira halochloris]MCG5531585.1 L,D-transpeptidase family protein [Halorhodospira halochloris]